MKKLLLLLSLAIAGILVSYGETPSVEQIRREFKGHLSVIRDNLPRKVTDDVVWKSIDYKPEKGIMVLTYEYANIHSPLSAEEAMSFYDSNLSTLRDAYAKASDPLVRFAVDGDMILRFSYVGSDGTQIATLDYPPASLK